MLSHNTNQEMAFGTGTNIYLGVVEDRIDPEKLGRVRVRVMGIHTPDIAELPTAHLPWSTVMLPSTSPGINGMGQNPFLVEGSWVVVMFMDSEYQEPLVLGSIAGKITEKRHKELGFSDPRGHYPRGGSGYRELEEFEKDINIRARNFVSEDENDIVSEREKERLKSLQKNPNYAEPEDPYEAKYPFNHVFESESGHIIELDDTPEHERVNIRHRLGSFIELHPNGDMRIRSKDFFISTTNHTVNIDGDCDVTVAKDANILIQGDTKIRSIGNVLLEAESDVLARVKGNTTLNSEKEITVNSNDEISITANADVNLDTTKNLYINVIGDPDDDEELEGIHIKTNNNMFIEAVKNVDFDVGGNFSVTANGDITMEARGQPLESDDDADTSGDNPPAIRFSANEDILIETQQNLNVNSMETMGINSKDSMNIGSSSGMSIDTIGSLGLTSTSRMGIHANGSLKVSSRSRTDVVGSSVHLNSSGAGSVGTVKKPSILNIDEFEIEELEKTTHQLLGETERPYGTIIDPIVRPLSKVPLPPEPETGDLALNEDRKFDWDTLSKRLIQVEIEPQLEIDVEADFPAPTYQVPEKYEPIIERRLEFTERRSPEEKTEYLRNPDLLVFEETSGSNASGNGDDTNIPDDDADTVLDDDTKPNIEKFEIDVLKSENDEMGSVTYTNLNAKRNLRLKPGLENIIKQAAQNTGLHVEIFSGGQNSTGPRRVGSHRHDDGFAADIYLYTDRDRRNKLRSDSNEAQSFIQAAISAGAESIGAGPRYMGGTGIHIDIAPGNVPEVPEESARYWGDFGRRELAHNFLKSYFA